jgi:hypothetical protein
MAIKAFACHCTLFLQPMKYVLLTLMVCVCAYANCQDSLFLKVHFLYGSKPTKQYRATEKKWFGGLLGGHVGLEWETGKVLHFAPKGKFHKWAKKVKHGKYIYGSQQEFYEILGGKLDSNQSAIVNIPISYLQKKTLDSIAQLYLTNTPYDYAFIGFRCGSASYETLAQIGILPKLGNTITKLSIFYPRKTRKRILKLAMENNWKIERKKGTICRKWEKDK